jgi:hypothetical protein
MKTARLLLTIIAFGAFAPGTGSAGEPARQSPQFHTRTTSLPLHLFHQPALKKAIAAVTDGWILNRTGNRPPARWPAGKATAASLPGAVRGRGAATAAIGGAAALDGAALKRKP